ncbi:hypothetical protein OC842_001886 [Tilletia horrida]|uniref:DNA replication regulator Sld3 C-terminal domain-containing protein n=1 Tax=Tilletia horrida TaxID=155126 RepID=A0AAN6JLU5_9BASI|nr:hypothetical protein OC842_001886 [Tilletia horrida]
MLLLSATHTFESAPSGASPPADEVLRRLYAATLWLGEAHTPMVAFLASFLAPDSLGTPQHALTQRVRVKEDAATVRSSVTYAKQLKPLFGLLRTVDELKNRHQPRPAQVQVAATAETEAETSASGAMSTSTSTDFLTDMDREVLATLCSSSHPCYNPVLDRRRQHHAREVQLQIVLVLVLLRYMTKHPPPAGMSAFLPPPPAAPRPFPYFGAAGRSMSLPNAANALSPGKQDVLALNKRFEALVEQLSVLQLRAVVPELQLGGAEADMVSKYQPLYARPQHLSVGAEDTPSKQHLHIPPAPLPRLFKLENLMATFYTPILEPLFADCLPQQLAQFRDRCGDIDVGDTVWASDPENSPVPNKTAVILPPPGSAHSLIDESAPLPPPSKSQPSAAIMDAAAGGAGAGAAKLGKKGRNIQLGTPDLAPEKKTRKHPPLLTKMIGGGREISMDSRTFTRCSSAGPGVLPTSAAGAMTDAPLLATTLTTTTTTTTTTLTALSGTGRSASGGGAEEDASTHQAAELQSQGSLPLSTSQTTGLFPPIAAPPIASTQQPLRENPFKAGPFSSAAKRKFPFSSAASGWKRANSVADPERVIVKKEDG